MTRYLISPAAERDIQGIYWHIARRSPQNADRVLAKLLEQFERIAGMPGIGHTRPELRDDTLRVISVFKFLVIYDPTRKPIEIVRVIHGHMDLGREFFQ
jgi:antitoxin ParD1/3/4/toxin ParE1/3/4